MKKYHNCFPTYGQSIVGRVNYYQKYGVAQGISIMLKRAIQNRGLDLESFKEPIDLGGTTIHEYRINVVLPNKDWLEGECPIFTNGKKFGIIDKLRIGGELSYHINYYENKQYVNGNWHTVREGLTLEQTCTLFEYIEDILNEITFEKG